MDATDKKILNLLQANAKQNTKEIAGQIKLTISPTFERIKKLEQQGVIKAYVAILDRTKIGKSLMAHCQISLFKHSKELILNFRKEVAKLPEIIRCHHVSGNYDFLLEVVVSDMNEYQRFVVEKLSTVEGISNIQSSFVMEEIKEGFAYPL
ncbi:Lrp/AsnC family transcriptional regulator [Aureispira sp. CCB-E]|uniref:Lrp/AsnC family transcriptional regulator n=1 Tax=Aureispira sp. CCB-E TaxID=3051121 RepID=UPI002868B46C|nr:Lrp/AsnC family transcriptional regulator [Aureispira sp. CCB-E]WMX16373.1 Lrp/AsnC family transcriptional regulator [Aureispira sp. CCB-E]